MQQLGNMKDNFDDLSDPEQFACLVSDLSLFGEGEHNRITAYIMGLKVSNISQKNMNLISKNYDHRLDFAPLEISFVLFSYLRTNQRRCCLWAQSYKSLIFLGGTSKFRKYRKPVDLGQRRERETGYVKVNSAHY